MNCRFGTEENIVSLSDIDLKYLTIHFCTKINSDKKIDLFKDYCMQRSKAQHVKYVIKADSVNEYVSITLFSF